MLCEGERRISIDKSKVCPKMEQEGGDPRDKTGMMDVLAI